MNGKSSAVSYRPYAVAAVALFVAVGILYGMYIRSRGFRIRIGDATISTEVSLTDKQKVRGLSGREALGPDSGMLFVYDHTEQYEFWMRGMRFPLDFIWIRDDIVVDLNRNIPPPMTGEEPMIIKPSVPADSVLEVNAGFVDSYGIRIGDKVEYLDK